jgi:hypothetical protein
MFIKVTDREGETVHINADRIMWIVPYRTKGHTTGSIIDMGSECYIKVCESPDKIVKLIENPENA